MTKTKEQVLGELGREFGEGSYEKALAILTEFEKQIYEKVKAAASDNDLCETAEHVVEWIDDRLDELRNTHF